MEAFGLLRKLYDDAVGWLKYAEAKNAALAAIAAGSLYAAINIATSHDNYVIVVVVGCSGAFFLLSLTVAVVSFVPITNPSFIALLETDRPEKAAPNLFFFGDLADLSEIQLIEQIGPRMKSADRGGADSHISDLAAQVIANSRIAERKLAFFEWGTWLFISGLLTPLVAFLLFWISGGTTRLRCGPRR